MKFLIRPAHKPDAAGLTLGAMRFGGRTRSHPVTICVEKQGERENRTGYLVHENMLHVGYEAGPPICEHKRDTHVLVCADIHHHKPVLLDASRHDIANDPGKLLLYLAKFTLRKDRHALTAMVTDPRGPSQKACQFLS